jgi:hypothetical protein
VRLLRCDDGGSVQTARPTARHLLRMFRLLAQGPRSLSQQGRSHHSGGGRHDSQHGRIRAVAPAVLELAVTKAVERLRGRGREGETKRADLVSAIEETDRELLNLTAAIASGNGGSISSIVQAISEREAPKTILARELKALGELPPAIRFDRATVKTRIAAIVDEWQTSIRKHVPQARSMLRKLLKGRITVTPEERQGVPRFRFYGEGRLQPVLAGWMPDFPQGGTFPSSFGRSCTIVREGVIAS